MSSRSITYFFRNPVAGFSIAKVSRIFVEAFKSKYQVREVTLPRHVRSFADLFHDFCFAYRNRNTKGINHVTGDCHFQILAFAGCKSVLTIHDAVQVDNQPNPLKRLLFKYLFFVLPLMVASRVVCISGQTRKSISRFTRRKDILVIPDAVDTEIFHYQPRDFRADCPHVLLVGTSWNKNVVRTVKALRNVTCQLHIIGQLTPEIMQALSDTGADYVSHVNLTDQEVYQRYVDADLVCFCSQYEGFGMPVIEAQATGRPVITSRIEPLIEVSGEGALFVNNPESEEEIRQAVQQIISQPLLRTHLIEAGLSNVQRFLPQTIVSQYEEVYNQLFD